MNRSYFNNIQALRHCSAIAFFLLMYSTITAYAAIDCSEPIIKEKALKAQQGAVEAQYELGYCYSKKMNKDYEKSFLWFKKAAEQEHADAQFYLAEMYKYGRGVAQNSKESVKWYQSTMALIRKLAEQGDATALYRLGWMYSEGLGVKRNKGVAIKWYKKAAKLGNVKAQFCLGDLYTSWQHDDREKALFWYKKAAEQGHAYACLALGFFYGKDGEEAYDTGESRKWYKKGVALIRKDAEQGDSRALFTLGKMYEQGYGVLQNKKEAEKFYNRAVELLRKVAEQGDPEIQFELGNMYYYGRQVSQDKEKAAQWYRKAAEHGHINALYKIIKMSSDGDGIAQDIEEVVQWVKKKYEGGDAYDLYYLGATFYNGGYGIPKDYKEAAKWYRKAAEQGLEYAQNSLADMYFEGEGVAKDYKEAISWYRKSAKQGNSWAQYSLGHQYEQGLGVLQDEIKAYAFYSLSAAGGNEGAFKSRNRLAKKISPQQIAQGRKFAAKLQRIIESPKDQSATSESSVTSTKNTKREINGSGTGFIIANNGYIVTCYHVIKDSGEIKVLIEDKEYTAKLIRADKHNDLALLKISGNFPALSFSSSRSAKMGQDVFTIGYPNPILQGVNQKLTEGNVNALTGYQDDIRLYQISVPVQPGNSGGALLDKNGDVVGIIVAILKAEAAFKVSGSLPQNVNYALKSIYAQTLIDTVPEAAENMQRPNSSQPFDTVVDRVKKSFVMIITYK